MKKLQLIVSIGLNVMILSLVIALSYIRYEIAKLGAEYYTDIGRYMPYGLIAVIVISFFIELYIIFRKE